MKDPFHHRLNRPWQERILRSCHGPIAQYGCPGYTIYVAVYPSKTLDYRLVLADHGVHDQSDPGSVHLRYYDLFNIRHTAVDTELFPKSDIRYDLAANIRDVSPVVPCNVITS